MCRDRILDSRVDAGKAGATTAGVTGHKLAPQNIQLHLRVIGQRRSIQSLNGIAPPLAGSAVEIMALPVYASYLAAAPERDLRRAEAKQETLETLEQNIVEFASRQADCLSFTIRVFMTAACIYVELAEKAIRNAGAHGCGFAAEPRAGRKYHRGFASGGRPDCSYERARLDVRRHAMVSLRSDSCAEASVVFGVTTSSVLTGVTADESGSDKRARSRG